MKRLRFLVIALAAGLHWASTAGAQDWPTRPLTMVVPFAAGGAFDVMGRVFTPTMSEFLHQQVVVENVGAAAGIVGTQRVAKAAPDGYTFLLGTIGTHAFNPAIYRKLPYNPVADFAPVALFAEQAMALVAQKDFPAENLAEFIAYTKANAAKVQYGSAGVGSTTHLACALLNVAAGLNVTHIPYRGGGPAMSDLIAGQIHYMCSNTANSMPQITGKTIKAIALLARTRSPLLPWLPTADEQSLRDFEAITWNAFFLPKGTPADIVSKLNAAVLNAMENPAVKERMQELGVDLVEPERRTPQYLHAFVESEIRKWAGPINAAAISID